MSDSVFLTPRIPLSYDHERGGYFSEICPKHPELQGECTPMGVCKGCYPQPGDFVRLYNEEKKAGKVRRREALAAGDKFYSGKLCWQHPELLGKRFTVNGCCAGCTNKHKSKSTTKLKRYRGEICPRHPEQLGLRHVNNDRCVICSPSASRSPEVRQRVRERPNVQDVGPRYNGKICPKHPELDGLRYTSNYACVRCALERVKASQAKAKARRLQAEIDAVKDSKRSDER